MKRGFLSWLVHINKVSQYTERIYNKLRPTGSQPPRIYGFPKIHKPDVPLRPIVACIASPSYQLSKYISDLISPLAGRTSSHVKNSAHFVEVMRSITIQDDEVLASFDITLLFTNVPVDEAVRVIKTKLQDDETLKDRTPLSADMVTELMELCLTSTYFSYDGEI